MIYGAAIGGTMGAINVGAMFTSVSTANGNLIEFKNNATAGSVNSTFNATSAGTYVAEMATFITNGSILPINLVSFEVRALDRGIVKLDWTTSFEKNNDYFEVQRSGEEKEWTIIRKIKGSDNSAVMQYYTTTDEMPEAGSNYYRLRQVDFDGKAEYSAVRAVALWPSDESKIICYPNPVIDWLQIDAGERAQENVAIYSVLGLNMNADVIGIIKTNSRISMNVSSLPGGMYTIRVGMVTTKFCKQ